MILFEFRLSTFCYYIFGWFGGSYAVTLIWFELVSARWWWNVFTSFFPWICNCCIIIFFGLTDQRNRIGPPKFTPVSWNECLILFNTIMKLCTNKFKTPDWIISRYKIQHILHYCNDFFVFFLFVYVYLATLRFSHTFKSENV